MLKGFKDFILKGNVIELATAVIVGAAFTAIVTAFTDGIVQPIINAIPVGSDAAQGLGFQITDNASTFVDLGSVITAVINFLIIAAVVYFIIIMPYNKLSELGGFGKKAEVTEVALLTEIRDLLDPDGTSKAKVEAQSDLPPHLSDPSGPGGDAYGPSSDGPSRSTTFQDSPVGQRSSDSPSGPLAPYSSGYDAPSGMGSTQRISTPVTPAPSSQPQQPPQSVPPQAPSQGGPLGGPSGQPYPTPQPAPGSYPPPGNYPQSGSYPPPSAGSPFPGDSYSQQYPGSGEQYPGSGEQFPGEGPGDAPGRHSR